MKVAAACVPLNPIPQTLHDGLIVVTSSDQAINLNLSSFTCSCFWKLSGRKVFPVPYQKTETLNREALDGLESKELFGAVTKLGASFGYRLYYGT